MSEFICIAPDVKLGKDVKLAKFINLYGLHPFRAPEPKKPDSAGGNTQTDRTGG